MLFLLRLLAAVAMSAAMALAINVARADEATCDWTIDAVVPLITEPHQVLTDPDAIKAFIEMLKGDGVTVPDGVTRILVAENDSGALGYGLEVAGCLSDWSPLPKAGPTT